MATEPERRPWYERRPLTVPPGHGARGWVRAHVRRELRVLVRGLRHTAIAEVFGDNWRTRLAPREIIVMAPR